MFVVLSVVKTVYVIILVPGCIASVAVTSLILVVAVLLVRVKIPSSSLGLPRVREVKVTGWRGEGRAGRSYPLSAFPSPLPFLQTKGEKAEGREI